MLRVPDYNFKINNFNWKIYLVKESDPVLNFDGKGSGKEDLEAWAITEVESLSIYLQSEKLDGQLYKSHIIHELVHAFLFSFGYQPEEMDEEGICYFFQHQAENIILQAYEIYEALLPKLIPRKEEENVEKEVDIFADAPHIFG